MLYYIFLFIFLGALCLLDLYPSIQIKRKKLLYAFFFIAVIFVGSRYWCDNDFENYSFFYDNIPILYKTSIKELCSIYLNWQVEIGYILSCSFLKVFGLGNQSIFFLCSFMTFLPLMFFFKKVSKYPVISFFFFFFTLFTLPFVQMRFGVATAFCMLALWHLTNNRKKKFWIWFVLALSFHLTSLVILGVYFLYEIKLSKEKALAICFISLGISFIPIKAIFIHVISMLGLGRYMTYTSDEKIGISSLIYFIIILFPFIYYMDFFKKRIQYYDLLLLMAVMTILIGGIVREVPILNRFSLLLSTSYSVIVPSYLLLLKRNSQLIGFILIVVFVILKFIPSLTHIDKYDSIFFNL